MQEVATPLADLVLYDIHMLLENLDVRQWESCVAGAIPLFFGSSKGNGTSLVVGIVAFGVSAYAGSPVYALVVAALGCHAIVSYNNSDECKKK